MSETVPLLIDTDPGVDDALALLMAFNSTRHRLLGLCITAGNVGLPHTTANALKLCEVAGIDVPVYPGCDRPLVFAAEDASYVHGRDGFGDIGYTPAERTANAEHAALAIVREAHAHAGRLLLVMLGPLTNLALALRLDPSLPDKIGRLVVMGGAVTGKGNTSVAAEFNIAFDPEAAVVVFEAFKHIELVDWEAVLRHGFLHRDIEAWLSAPNPIAGFYAEISQKTRLWAESSSGGGNFDRCKILRVLTSPFQSPPPRWASLQQSPWGGKPEGMLKPLLRREAGAAGWVCALAGAALPRRVHRWRLGWRWQHFGSQACGCRERA